MFEKVNSLTIYNKGFKLLFNFPKEIFIVDCFLHMKLTLYIILDYNLNL